MIRSKNCRHFAVIAGLSMVCGKLALPAAPDRIQGRVDASKVRRLSGQVHPYTRTAKDLGPADSTAVMPYVVMAFKPTDTQQAELEQLLADQQNPSSPQFNRWLSPEEYGRRFGLSASDESKVSAWLTSQGLTPAQHARGRNWIAFRGSVDKVSAALRTPIRRFEIHGETHMANVSEPAVPEALAGLVAGFLGLHDFRLKPNAKLGPAVSPDYSRSGIHYISPADWNTIYNATPLAQAGIDGTGVSIAVVGQSDVLISDIRTFRSQFGLPANDPKVVFYSGVDPGTNGAEVEGALDLEWAGAIAPKASLYYVTGQDAFAAAIYSVNANLANIITISYSGCEALNQGTGGLFQAFAQQANAQGITILAASGDSGADGCDVQGLSSYSAQGIGVNIPASVPEVTGVGGTQFSENGGVFWKSANDTLSASAMSYIPEAAWNETSVANGLLATGGGLSAIYPKPAWQQGPGVPSDNRRAVPDVSFSAALHDGYLFTYAGGLYVVAGTSASTPSMAGLVALLNQYRVKKALQSKAGLGNINPQLYRLAQEAPSAFHDVTAGDNKVPCLLGSQDCTNSVFGYQAGPGYDLATGLGSVDANNLITQWTTASSPANVKLSLSSTRVDLNSVVTATATVTAAGGGTPTGSVAFSFSGIPVGTVPVKSNGSSGTASIEFPSYIGQGTGNGVVSALYSGDASFSSAGATAGLRVTAPTGASGILLTAPSVVYPGNPDAQGLTWQTVLTLFDISGYASLITGFAIDGQPQSMQKYIPSGNLPANGTLKVSYVTHNLTSSVTHTFSFTGIDSTGYLWTREIKVSFSLVRANADFELTATPLSITQGSSGSNLGPNGAGCSFPAQISVTDEAGFSSTLGSLSAGSVDLSSSIPGIFGTSHLGPFGTLTGTVCLDPATAPGTQTITALTTYDAFNVQVGHDVTLSLAPPPAVPIKMTPSLQTVGLAAPDGSSVTAQPLNLNLSDKSQAWSLSVLPNNRTAGWLTVSPMSGVGPAVITVSASGKGYGPGVYYAQLVLQALNASPQSVTVPVAFTLGGNAAGTAITSVGDAASFAFTVSPGAIIAIVGRNLANVTETVPSAGSALPNSYEGVSATVNGYPAPLQYLSPKQVNVQIPYEVGVGRAALGINNNGSIASFLINVAPSAPGIFADENGNLLPSNVVKQGVPATLYITGAGDTSPSIATGIAPTLGTAASVLPAPRLPLSVAVSGAPVFVTFAGIPQTAVGVMQVNFMVPPWIPAGPQTLVVTVNGIPSKPVNIQVAAPPLAGTK